MVARTTTRFVVSRQGNRNLVLDADDADFYRTIGEADQVALRRAHDEGENYFVHTVTVSLVRTYRPRVEVDVIEA